jgi:hypothetical protein
VNERRDDLLAKVRSLSRIDRPKEARHDMPEPLYRAIGLAGAACIVEGRGQDSVLASVDQWLGKEPPTSDAAAPRAELVRRFLHCYGPSTPRRFAEWTGRSLRDAKAAFELVDRELVEVRVAEGRAWLLSSDQKAMESPPRPSGVRLIPSQDPYLQQRDRTVLLEDDVARKRLWRPVRGPGAVLVDGEIVGAWHARKAGSLLQVGVEPFPPAKCQRPHADRKRVGATGSVSGTQLDTSGVPRGALIGRGALFVAIALLGFPGRDLLNDPTVTVRIAEENTPDHIEGFSRSRGSKLSRLKHLHLTDVHTLLDEMITRRTDVGYHQKQILDHPCRPFAACLSQMNRAAGPLRCQLKEAETISRVVDIDIETNLLCIKILRAV